MTVQEGPGEKGQKEIRTSYPKTEGLVLGTTKISGRDPYLKPLGLKGTKSIVRTRDKVGL